MLCDDREHYTISPCFRQTVQLFFSQLVVSMVGNAILLTGVLVLLFLEDWRVGLSMLIFSLVALVVLVRIRALAIPRWKIVREQ